MKTAYVIIAYIAITLSVFMVSYFFQEKPPQNKNTIIVFEKVRNNITNIRGTVYCPTDKQNKQYIRTSSGRLVRNDSNIRLNRILSLSQDLFFQYNLYFGDSLYCDSDNVLLVGKWFIEDAMESNMVRSCDFLFSKKDMQNFKQGVYKVNFLLYDR